MKQTAVEWLIEKIKEARRMCDDSSMEMDIWHTLDVLIETGKQAKAMEKEQIGYTKEDVLTAGEMGEINTFDTKHIVSYLDEAKQFNETYG
jgi:hypothetical protein